MILCLRWLHFHCDNRPPQTVPGFADGFPKCFKKQWELSKISITVSANGFLGSQTVSQNPASSIGECNKVNISGCTNSYGSVAQFIMENSYGMIARTLIYGAPLERRTSDVRGLNDYCFSGARLKLPRLPA